MTGSGGLSAQQVQPNAPVPRDAAATTPLSLRANHVTPVSASHWPLPYRDGHRDSRPKISRVAAGAGQAVPMADAHLPALPAVGLPKRDAAARTSRLAAVGLDVGMDRN